MQQVKGNRMYHFFVEREQFRDDGITVIGSDVNHIKNVLRMKSGEQVLISDKQGGDYLCEIKEFAQETVLFGILEARGSGMELPARVHLFQGLPKGDKMELIIQKAVELGAYRIIPVETKRVVVKLDAKKEEARVKRWNAISESAAKQSKRSMIPEVTGVATFREALQMAEDFSLKLIPYECAAGMQETRKLLEKAEPGMDIAVFIGPEGGLEGEEIRMAEENGIIPVTLGKRILRTETAGLCILSALMIHLEQ